MTDQPSPTPASRSRLLYDAAMLAGSITLESGAEIFRVEDTMHRILSLSGFSSIEVFATTTGIFATLAGPSAESITQIRRISSRANNLNRICQVNEVSRELCSGKISPEEAICRLERYAAFPPIRKKWVMGAILLSTIGFALLFGGGMGEVLASAAACIVMQSAGLVFSERLSNGFMDSLLKTMVIAFTVDFCCLLFPSLDNQNVMISSIMPLVPGLPITNAIRDTLQGDYNAGLSRAAEAFVIALALAVGSVAGMGAFRLITGLL